MDVQLYVPATAEHGDLYMISLDWVSEPGDDLRDAVSGNFLGEKDGEPYSRWEVGIDDIESGDGRERFYFWTYDPSEVFDLIDHVKKEYGVELY